MNKTAQHPTAQQVAFVTRSELSYAAWAIDAALEQIATDEPLCEEDYLAEGRRETRQILRIAKARIAKKMKGDRNAKG